MKHPEFHRRNLPHWHPAQGAFFVTFCLRNALPAAMIEKLKQELATELSKPPVDIIDYADKCYKRHFARFDNALAEEIAGNHCLKQYEIATIVSQALKYYDGKDYELVCFCIMSNHVHVLLNLREASRDLSEIMHSIKRFTTSEANKTLKRQGQFWQYESYDRLVRDKTEFGNIVAYILNNPVKAGLVEIWQNHPYSYWKDA